MKQELLRRVGGLVDRSTVIVSSSLRLPLDKVAALHPSPMTSAMSMGLLQVFAGISFPERTLGLRCVLAPGHLVPKAGCDLQCRRFLFPVYAVAEVEVSPWAATDRAALLLVTGWLERMGEAPPDP